MQWGNRDEPKFSFSTWLEYISDTSSIRRKTSLFIPCPCPSIAIRIVFGVTYLELLELLGKYCKLTIKFPTIQVMRLESCTLYAILVASHDKKFTWLTNLKYFWLTEVIKLPFLKIQLGALMYLRRLYFTRKATGKIMKRIWSILTILTVSTVS